MNLIPTDGSQAKLGNWLKIALFVSPFFLLFNLLIKESDLRKAVYSNNRVKNGYVFLIIYVIISFALMIFLSLYKKGKL
jgi:hypothetical protein